jgi:hypothetical protein
VECIAPEKSHEPSASCLDCSRNFDTIEETDPGFCKTIARDYSWEALRIFTGSEKKRRYQLKGDWFPETPGTADLKLTQTMLDSNFKFEFIGSIDPSNLKSVKLITLNVAEITFEDFFDDMELQISLVNSVLEKNIVSPTQEIPIKILKFKEPQKLDKFQIRNESPYSEAITQAVSGAATVGNSAIVLGTIFNVDISGTMMKAIQFILLFDKLRLLNVQYENLLGEFMDSIYSAFKARIINIDDYESNARLKWNMFYAQRVQIPVYRRKLDKILIGIACLVIEIMIFMKNKKLAKIST